MKHSFLLLSFIAVTAVAASQPAVRQNGPVVVELFTSEGCSDCPPADDIVNAMVQHPQADLNVIPLAFHVTYWDTYGWRDRFSDTRYTERQVNYEREFHVQSPYTPQSVIDGQYQAVGNDRGKVLSLIRRAAADPKPVEVAVSTTDRQVNVTARSSAPTATGNVLLAITEDGLSTEVKAGENRARTLQHSAVVRSLETIGKMNDGAFTRSVRLRLRKEWTVNPLHAVVLVQDGAGRVVGAGTAPIETAVPLRGAR